MVDNLRRWGFSIANWCCLCKKNEEFVHVLIHWEYISDLWQLVLNLFGLGFVGYALQHPRTTSLLEDLGAGTSQMSHLEIYSCFINVEHFKTEDQHLF